MGTSISRAPATCSERITPARILHGSASEGLSDPRLNLVKLENAALLRETGGSPLCASTWGKDAIYDMVGNVGRMGG